MKTLEQIYAEIDAANPELLDDDGAILEGEERENALNRLAHNEFRRLEILQVKQDILDDRLTLSGELQAQLITLDSKSTKQNNVHFTLWKRENILRKWAVVDVENAAEKVITDARKVWATANDFLAEFSDEELANIAVSNKPKVAVVRMQFLVWPGEVWSDDSRLVAGMEELVTADVLSEESKVNILTK